MLSVYWLDFCNTIHSGSRNVARKWKTVLVLISTLLPRNSFHFPATGIDRPLPRLYHTAVLFKPARCMQLGEVFAPLLFQ